MDGAWLSRKQFQPGSTETPHPTGLPELFRQRGTETQVEVVFSQDKRGEPKKPRCLKLGKD